MEKSYTQPRIRWAILIIGFIMSLNEAYASHAQGADLTYTCIGGNQYQLRLSFYRDCSGAAAPGNVQINIASVSCNQNFDVTLQPLPGTGIDVTPICPSMTTTCNNGNNPGVQEWIYQGVVTLPMACTDWIFSFDFCCRNNAINTIVNPGGQNIFVQSHLNNVNGPCNNSPTFSNRPIPFVCVGQQYCFNHGANDIDGDSLAYSLIAPQNSPNTNVTYIAPYSATQPVPSNPAMTFNSATGDICMTPTQIIVTVMAVRVEEWRNGVLIGSVVRDIQLRTIFCNNNNPYLTGINNTNSYTASVCAGNTLTFPIYGFDADAGQNLIMTWNNSIPGASFTSNGGNATFSWTPSSTQISATPYCFTVTVADDACPYSGSQTYAFCITVGGFNLQLSSTSANCGASNGSASVVASNGVAPYTYSWAPSGGNNANANGLSAGIYTVTVTDATGCSISDTISVGQGAAPGNIQSSVIDIACFGQNTGSATVSVNGGQQPYTYAWSNGGNTATINNLSAGTYSVLVTTANGCVTTATVTITQPASALTTTTTSANILCNGNNTGSATVNAQGGTAPYSYAWSNSNQNINTQNNLPAGTYSVTVTDNNGCTSQQVFTITAPPGIAGVTSSSPATCFGGSNGSAQVIVSGGVGPYNISWNSTPVQTGNNAINLSAGTYVVTITDANGCSVYPAVTITQPPALTATTVQTNTSCFGGNNGSANVTAGGGTPPYNYQWNTTPQQFTAQANSLTAGSYTVTVTDANGCATIGTATIQQPTPVQLAISNGDTVCPGTPVVISATATGGTGNHNYNWNQSLGNNASYTVYPSMLTQYIVSATDANGCSSGTDTITLDVFQFSPANLVTTGNTSICFGNSATINSIVTGNTGMLTYQWNTTLTGPGPHLVSPTTTTLYQVTVINECGVAVSGNIQVVVNPLPQTAVTPVSASGCGKVELTLTDTLAQNAGNWFWDFGDNTAAVGNPVQHSYNATGNYLITITTTSAAGCSATFTTNAAILIYDVPAAAFEVSTNTTSILEPTVAFSDLSTSNVIAWMWDFGDSTTSNLASPSHTYAQRGTYNVRLVVSAPGGCTDTTFDEIIVNPELTLYVPNAFTPNGDGLNDNFLIYGEEIQEMNMMIFDRWGNMIFTSTSVQEGWDGRANGGADVAQQDVYVYKIQVKDLAGKQHKQTGHVSLIR